MRRFLATIGMLATLPGGAIAAPSECKGTLSGAVQATFKCAASISTNDEGMAVFEIRPLDRLDDIPGYAPGAFEVPGPVTARTYMLDDLGMDRASVAVEGGTLYTATKTSSQRGEITLVLSSVSKDARAKGTYVAHGTYRARLLPVGGGKKGEIIVEVSF